MGGGVVQFVECPVQRAADTGSNSSAARDVSPRVSFQCRLSYSLGTTPVCSCMHQHVEMHMLKS